MVMVVGGSGLGGEGRRMMMSGFERERGGVVRGILAGCCSFVLQYWDISTLFSSR